MYMQGALGVLELHCEASSIGSGCMLLGHARIYIGVTAQEIMAMRYAVRCVCEEGHKGALSIKDPSTLYCSSPSSRNVLYIL